MADSEDIFSDTLGLFESDDALGDPPTEVHYGPIESKIVSSKQPEAVLWYLSLTFLNA